MSRKGSPPHLCACGSSGTLRSLQHCAVRNWLELLWIFMRASDQPRLTLCVAGAGASLTQGGDPCGALLLAETAAVLLAGGAVEREAKKHSSISLQVGKTSAAFSNHASTACPTACRTAVGPAGGVVARLWLKMLQRS